MIIPFSMRLKALREARGVTQSEIARTLSITRNGYNSWEQGLSMASPVYLIELSKLFGVSVDYLLGADSNANLNVEGVKDKDVAILTQLVASLRE
ncbi:MAG: helix-turn-helix domain-containing protein [Oscillospiraceae bacterium]|nr:helix-turn-helix domain-containing protein [Oscillospiraceae bacterium]